MINISVVIPIFNTAPYLKECLDSVLNQTFTDFEVICVNDGSNDSSLEILKKYQQKDNRIKIINQENKGAGAARNVGIDHSRGEYILFLDSDDYLDKDTLNDCYEIAHSKSLDILLFKIINFDNETYKTSRLSYFEMKFLNDLMGDKIFSWKDVQHRLFDVSITAPGKLFRKELIQNVRFPENIIFEDNVFFIRLIFNAKRMYLYDKFLYYRRLRSDSVTNSYYEKFSDCIEAYSLIEEHIKKTGNYYVLEDQFFNRKCQDVYTRFSQLPSNLKPEYFDKIKEDFLKNQAALEKDGTLKVCNKRSLHIYNTSLTSDTYKEFELDVIIFDLSHELDKCRLNNNLLKIKYEDTIHSMKKEYKDEMALIMNSNSWKLTKIFRVIGNNFKKLYSHLV